VGFGNGDYGQQSVKTARLILTGGFVVLIVGTVIWFGSRPASEHDGAAEPIVGQGPASAVRIGIVPERDIFAQHRRYRALGEYLSAKLGRPVQVVTLNTYEAVLDDLRDKQIEAAFLGSMVALLAHDRLGAKVVLKTETGGASTYRGVVFVREDSPIRSVAQLAGKTVAGVKTTTAGDLFTTLLFKQHGLLGPTAPANASDARATTGSVAMSAPARMTWMGTHDEVIRGVVEGSADAGAAKDLRIQAFLKSNTAIRLRELAVSAPVPNNALVVRVDIEPDVRADLVKVLLGMANDSRGQQELAAFGADRFMTCELAEFEPVCRMACDLGDDWARLGVSGPPPSRSADGACPCTVPSQVRE
jgi:phosphonate transport system substrate-binding protein